MHVSRTGPFSLAIAAEIRAEMARKQKTGAQLGNLLGFTQAHTSRRVNGHDPYTTNELAVIGEWLDTPASELLRRAEVVVEQTRKSAI